jgi:predicted metalloprotease
MKWRGRGGGGRIEDRRGSGGGFGRGGGMGMPIPIPMGRAGGGGLGTILLVVVVFLVLRGCGGAEGFGVDPGTAGLPQAPSATPQSDLNAPPADEAAQFVDFVAGDVDRTWTRLFSESGQRYEPATIVLYDDAVSSGCGNTPATVGPFYCPLDSKVYLDLEFMNQLQQRLGAQGDFAQAYIVAHEIGHHVQNVLGYEKQLREAQRRDPERANELSVRFELQADCLAGVWGHSTQKRNLLESGDVEAGLKAAAAIGDDTLQKQSGGQVSPESWTHGSSEQRMKWLRRGLESGTIDSCDTSGPL